MFKKTHLTDFNNSTNGLDIPIAHSVNVFYKKIYLLGKQIPKRDRFGIFATIETTYLKAFELIIEAIFSEKKAKKEPLKNAHIKIEVCKRLIRVMQEVDAINANTYIDLQTDLQSISKMISGWINYLA